MYRKTETWVGRIDILGGVNWDLWIETKIYIHIELIDS